MSRVDTNRKDHPWATFRCRVQLPPHSYLRSLRLRRGLAFVCVRGCVPGAAFTSRRSPPAATARTAGVLFSR